MQKALHLIQVTPEELQTAIVEGVKAHLDDLKKSLQPKDFPKYMTRQEVADWLKVDISTVHNWTVKGVLKKYGIEGKVYYKSAEVEKAIIEV